ncbi:electron transfer flavoprotein subunit alpha/FixB family protein [Heliobacterium gestii]|uniref:Electron transfer flavoprotein subunit alpha/FixB family protein n=1 Tax=Heliomicrobium gestii TaxID=2699 RepID=A0A845LBE6_HELGE|nr:electron transfer flavoprotein subunit alpha/FixB family protein [Heliomicrobium gestii]MBM7867724.1 electron transfer flavoprotein alpha subunit [Heliomicrobium gestii]MZP44117.1 electron transfer flavoprotein subunit alpha/FixB family protein [Heliomicrobium gestii]
MAKIWVVAEAQDQKLKKVSLEMITLARQLGDVEALLIGDGVAAIAPELGNYGVSKVIVADHADLQSYTAAKYARVLSELIQRDQPEIVLIANTATGRDVAPRVAQRVGAGQISDIIDYADGQFIRPIYAGKAFQRVTAVAHPLIVTVRPNVFAAAEAVGGTAAVETAAVSLAADDLRVLVRDVVRQISTRPELTEAEIIVSGGRGMKGAENFRILEALADVLGAAVGASRAAVDAGWRPHQDQVGQTGKTVSPTLYIAAGISGAIQHLAGMSGSKVIVAINKDPEANIFKVADYGIVGDLFEVVPLLTEEFKRVLDWNAEQAG